MELISTWITMAIKNKLDARSSEFAHKFQQLQVQLKGKPFSYEVWAELSVEEREAVGPTGAELHCVDLWRKAKDVSVLDATIALADQFDLISPRQKRQLQRFTTQVEQPVERPSYDISRGELKFANAVVRTLRVRSDPTNIQQVVEHFQKRGWPSLVVVDDWGWDWKKVSYTVESLNDGLEVIRFHSTRSGTAISWSVDSNSGSTPSEVR